jgi:hypothetical protein
MDARRLLAHAYRVDGHADEAGRWGYLDEGAATDAERAAYEHGCQHRRGTGWAATSTLNGLHWPTDAPAPTLYAAQALARLTATAAREDAAWQSAINPAPMRIAQRAAKHLRVAAKEKARKARRKRAT